MQDIWTITKNASVVIGKFLSVKVSAEKVYRVIDCYCKVIGKSECGHNGTLTIYAMLDIMLQYMNTQLYSLLI